MCAQQPGDREYLQITGYQKRNTAHGINRVYGLAGTFKTTVDSEGCSWSFSVGEHIE